MEELIDIKTLSKKVHLSERTIWRIIAKEDAKKKEGKGKGFPYYKIGRLVRFKESEVEKFLEKYKQGGD